MASMFESTKFANESTNLIGARRPWGSNAGSGRAALGVLEVPHLRKLCDTVEQKLAAANTADEERRSRPQSGLRVAAREALAKEWARREEEIKKRPPRSSNNLYHRTSAENPLATGWEATTLTAISGRQAQGTKVRMYDERDLPNTVRTHVAPYMRPLTTDLERERQHAQEQAWKHQEFLATIKQAKDLGKRLCEENPHGVSRLALAKLKASKSGLVCLADIPSLPSSAR